jgi:hypothetical protein
MRDGTMVTGRDVTDVGWEPPGNACGGLGEVTIEHHAMDDVIMPMSQSAAERLANRLLGDDNRELPRRGSGFHWVKRTRETDWRLPCRKTGR